VINADLTDDEIAHICKPLTQGAAQCRYLRGLGLTVRRRPDGSPLVNRAHYDATMGGGQAGAKRVYEPNWGTRA
jgi:hypothetical protein